MVQVYSLLIIKVGDRTVAMRLNPRELGYWERHPGLARNPARALRLFRRAVSGDSPRTDAATAAGPEVERFLECQAPSNVHADHQFEITVRVTELREPGGAGFLVPAIADGGSPVTVLLDVPHGYRVISAPVATITLPASLRAARDVTVAYRLTGAQYRGIDLLALADELAARVPLPDHPLLRPGREFFVAYAVAEATGITATFAASTDRAAKLTMELVTAIKADGSVEVTGDHHGRLVIAGGEPVTFGLAVAGVKAGGEGLRIDPAPRPRAVRGGAGWEADDVPSVMFGGPDGDALVGVG